MSKQTLSMLIAAALFGAGAAPAQQADQLPDPAATAPPAAAASVRGQTFPATQVPPRVSEPQQTQQAWDDDLDDDLDDDAIARAERDEYDRGVDMYADDQPVAGTAGAAAATGVPRPTGMRAGTDPTAGPRVVIRDRHAETGAVAAIGPQARTQSPPSDPTLARQRATQAETDQDGMYDEYDEGVLGQRRDDMDDMGAVAAIGPDAAQQRDLTAAERARLGVDDDRMQGDVLDIDPDELVFYDEQALEEQRRDYPDWEPEREVAIEGADFQPFAETAGTEGFSAGATAQMATRRFNQLDRDRTSELTREQVQGTELAQRFDEYDINNDGVIAPNEFQSFFAAQRQQPLGMDTGLAGADDEPIMDDDDDF